MEHDQEQDALLPKLTLQFETMAQEIKEDREHDRLQDQTLVYILDKLTSANVAHNPKEVQQVLRFEHGLNRTQLLQPMSTTSKQWVGTHDLAVWS